MYDWLQRVWYGSDRAGFLLVPLGWMFGLAVAARRSLYRYGILPVVRSACPVIVVGNITAGGTGKTPLVLWLAKQLGRRGIRAGIAGRGYGGRLGGAVRLVRSSDTAELVGDEPLLMRRHNPLVAAGADRCRAVQRLVEEGADVVICDDGLQHYRLHRDMEIAVVDGVRRSGNGRLLPAGPLREPESRMRSVDWVVCNGGKPGAGEIAMILKGDRVVSIDGERQLSLGELTGQRCHALAAIGHPERFFDVLRAAGIDVIPHPLADHADPGPLLESLVGESPILMTEKDAVKCQAAGGHNLWYLPVEATLDESAGSVVDAIESLVARAGDGGRI